MTAPGGHAPLTMGSLYLIFSRGYEILSLHWMSLQEPVAIYWLAIFLFNRQFQPGRV
jgi:hypothetical protein